MINEQKLIADYLSQNDWRVNENSNVNYSHSGLLLHCAGEMIKEFTLGKYPEHIARAHRDGDIHIHDLSMGIAGYCAGWSLKQLLIEGFNGVSGKVESNPPKHLSVALSQMVNFLGTLQNEWAGAMAFSSFDTYLAPFVRVDELTYTEVKQLIQQFVFNLNVTSRWGSQTPFTNITLDWVVPEDVKTERVIVGGKRLASTYGEYQAELDIINKAFIEVMIEGDAKGRIFTFPIPTYNITKEFEWDTPNADLLFLMTAKYGIPYFQNFVNSSLKPSDVRSMCCRLQMDLRLLKSKTGGLFGSGESTGSIGVVTLNMSRIGFFAKSDEEFLARVKKLMVYAKDSLELKRKFITEYMDMGLFPYSQRYLGHFQNHFSTVGLNGMNEALLNFKGVSIATPQGSAFAKKVLLFMRDTLSEFQEETGNLYNLEATPAEGTGYRFARLDRMCCPGIHLQGKSEPYYTNSTQLPVQLTDDIFEALDLQDGLQTQYTGGTVFHGFLGEQITDLAVCKQLVKTISHSYKLPYFTLTPTFSICPKHGYISGEHHICPKCQTEVKHGISN